MPYQLKRGLGDIATPSATATPQSPANPCGTKWSWTIPDCWQWPKSLIYGSNYVSTPMPPAVGSTLPDGSAIPVVPVSGAAAIATVQDLTDAQIADTQAQNQWFFENLDPIVNPPSSTNWLLYGVIGVGVLALVSMSSGGSARRYGR